jgi:4-carboxymuconolactone decarboxylase
MARIPYMSRENVDPVLERMFYAGAPQNFTLLLAHAPANAVPFVRMNSSVLCDQELDARLRELCILYVARLCRCDYEWVQHVRVAAAVGVSEAEIERVRDLEDPAGAFAAPCSDALSLCRQMVVTHSAESDTVRRVHDALGARQLMELMFAITTYRTLGTIMNALAVDPEPPMSADAAALLATGHWSEAMRQPQD